jgi:hypothetical protein
MKLCAGLPNIRHHSLVKQIFGALRGARQRFGTRLVHYSVQSNHLHLLVETEGKGALKRAMQGLGVRIAHALNKHLRRHGHVFADRYHSRALVTPLEVRHAIRYVLQNHLHHASGPRPHTPSAFLDPLSTAPYFDGFTVKGNRLPEDAPVVPARTWLLRTGWRMHGLIAPDETPA